MKDLTILIPGIVGAFVGAIGWLFVGLYIQRRQFIRQAKNSARAVYFEVAMNRLSVQVALEYGSFSPLSRTSFDRLLPELATWLRPGELHTIVTAYMAHAGYEQMSSDSELPPEIRRQALAGILGSQESTLALLRTRVFSANEARQLEQQQLAPSNATEIRGAGDRAVVRPSKVG